MPRTLKEDRILKVLNSQRAAKEAKEEAAKAAEHGHELARSAQDALQELRLKIASREWTTRDRALDINIVVYESAEKDATYKQLVDLEEAANQHVGELVMLQRDLSNNRRLAILPEDPRVVFDVPITFPRRIVFGGRTDPVMGLHVPFSVRDGVVHGELLARGKNLLGNFLFEPEIRELLDEMNPWSALSVWEDSRLLGRPLEPSVALRQEIQTTREVTTAEIVKTMTQLEKALLALKNLQHDQRVWSKGQPELTQEGLTITFTHEVSAIRDARRKLVGNIVTAGSLGMSDVPVSKVFLAGQKLIDETQEWAS
jgi:hypothetical protein